MNGKNPWLSKTYWFGALQVISAILLLLLDSDLIRQYPNAIATIGLVSGIVTIILRNFTSLPIEWADKPPDKGTTDDDGGTAAT